MAYLIGVIVSTWIVIRFADKSEVNFDILGMYLTYLVTGAGVNSSIKIKEQQPNKVETTVVQTTTTALAASPEPSESRPALP